MYYSYLGTGTGKYNYNTTEIAISFHNDWFADQVFTRLQYGKNLTDVKASSKLSDLKPVHVRWIVDW